MSDPTRDALSALAGDVRNVTNEVLLDAVARERISPHCDEQRLRAMIDTLVEHGVYPPIRPGNPNDVYAMVQGYGADWHVWKEPLACPHCKADLRDQRTGPPFKREIVQIVNDRSAGRTCPDCSKTF